MSIEKDSSFEPFDSNLNDFYNLRDSQTKEIIESNIRAYYLNRGKYSRDVRDLTLTQIETIIRLRNSGVKSEAVANSLKMHTTALTKVIKRSGYSWSISRKLYVQKDEVPKKLKKHLTEKTRLYNLVVEPSVFRMISLRSYLQNLSYSQVISEAILETTPKELHSLALKPSEGLNFQKLLRTKK